RRVGDRAIGSVDDLLIANPAVERRTAIAENLAVDLGSELLGAEQDDVEVTPSRGNIHERISQAALAAGWCVFVELIDEDDELVDAHLALFGEFPDCVDRGC